MTSEWLKSAMTDVHIREDEIVAVDEAGLVFHDPDELDSTLDMDRVEIGKASEESSPCSKCFPTLNAMEESHFRLNIPSAPV